MGKINYVEVDDDVDDDDDDEYELVRNDTD